MNKDTGKQERKLNIFALSAATVHFILTFFTDHSVFEALKDTPFYGLSQDKLAYYLACKAALFVLLYYIYKWVSVVYSDILNAIKKRTLIPEGSSSHYKVFLYGMIYFIPIAAVMVFKLPQGFLSNDETLIFAEASALNQYTWFYYLTTFYYIITMMLIPSWVGPILVKIALQVITCGYCVHRFRGHFKSRISFLMYLPFMMFPVLAYTTSAHRIPVYYLLYLLFWAVLFFDRLENRIPDASRIFWLVFCAALLTQWRTEGIYMALFGMILILMAYPALTGIDGKIFDGKNINWKDLNLKSFDKKQPVKFILIFLLMQYAISIPQNGALPMRMQDKADNRMGPFWAYTITNMYRNGLDLEKNKDDLELIYRYLDKNVLKSINEDLKDINYEDTLILYYPGYTGVIEGATPDDYNAYVQGCRNIFKNNPGVFLKTRWGAFCYAALPYHLVFDQGPLKGAFFAFKALSYNLFIPCVILLILFIVAVVRKRWMEGAAAAALMCHAFIVFVLAPASYFKYYLPVYMCAYFALWCMILCTMNKRFFASLRMTEDKDK